MKPQLEAALELWWRRQVSALRRVGSDVRAGTEREYERPGWDFLDSVAFQIREPDQQTAEPPGDDSEMKAKLRSIPTNLLTATRKYLTTANQTTSEFAASQKTPSQGVPPKKKRTTAKVAGKEVDFDAALEAAPAALDAVLDITSLVSNWWKERAADRPRLERLAQVEKEADRLAQLVAGEALPMWDQVVADTKLEIETSTHEAIETGEALEHTIEQIEAAVRIADGLLERLPALN